MQALIVGHFGGKNTGDEAMLAGLLELLRPNDTASILTKDKEALKWVNPRHQLLEAGPLNRFSVIGNGFDTFIFCGGTHFHDNYSPLRLLRHWMYLVVQVILVFLAKKKGLRVLVLGNGFGPLSFWLTKKLTRTFCGLADLVSVRDNHSHQVLDKLNVMHHIQTDLALLNKFATSEKTEVILGVSVTNHPGYSRYLSEPDYLNRVSSSISKLSSDNKIARVQVIVIRGGDVESDLPLSEGLVRKLRDLRMDVDLVDHQDDPAKMISAIGKCTFFIGARFHSIVLSLLTKVPYVGIIPYHQKLSSLAEDLGLTSNLIDIYDEAFTFDGSTSQMKIDDSVQQKLQTEILSSKQLLKQTLYGE